MFCCFCVLLLGLRFINSAVYFCYKIVYLYTMSKNTFHLAVRALSAANNVNYANPCGSFCSYSAALCVLLRCAAVTIAFGCVWRIPRVFAYLITLACVVVVFVGLRFMLINFFVPNVQHWWWHPTQTMRQAPPSHDPICFYHTVCVGPHLLPAATHLSYLLTITMVAHLASRPNAAATMGRSK